MPDYGCTVHSHVMRNDSECMGVYLDERDGSTDAACSAEGLEAVSPSKESLDGKACGNSCLKGKYDTLAAVCLTGGGGYKVVVGPILDGGTDVMSVRASF